MNKAQKTKRCREILHGTSKIVDEESSRFLIGQVFPNHPEWEEKVGIGIHHLEVRPNGYGGRGFWIVRRDGSTTDISFVAAISPPKKRTDVMKACRTVIRPEIEKLRATIALPFVCPITGETVSDKRGIHIDHYDLTFREVFDEWMKGKDLEELYSKTRASNKDNSTDTYFDDEETCRDFLAFHNAHTHLRAVSKKANLSILRKG